MRSNLHLVVFEDRDSLIKGSGNFPLGVKESFFEIEEIEAGFEEELSSFTELRFIEYWVGSEEELMKKLKKEEGFNIYLCGSHFISYPACLLEKPKTYLQFDFHPDLRDEYKGRKYSHATVVKRIVEEGIKVVQIGIGEQSIEDLMNAKKYGVKQFLTTPIFSEVEDILEDPVYLSLDGDAFTFFNNVSTPSLSKISSTVFYFFQQLFYSKEVVSFDLVELLNEKKDVLRAAQLIRKLIFYKFKIRERA